MNSFSTSQANQCLELPTAAEGSNLANGTHLGHFCFTKKIGFPLHCVLLVSHRMNRKTDGFKLVSIFTHTCYGYTHINILLTGKFYPTWEQKARDDFVGTAAADLVRYQYLPLNAFEQVQLLNTVLIPK